jgi:hypothetical protein
MDDKNFLAANYLQQYGGGFASALAIAWFKADSRNQRRILSVFQDLFDEAYASHQKTIYLKDYHVS